MANIFKILIIDDDDDLLETLRDSLDGKQEFETFTGKTAVSFIKQCAPGNNWDVVLLDVGLPDMDGREACKIVRKKGFNVPIIMLSGETSDTDVVLGLDAGANDYITKPFRLPVLIARVRAQLRDRENRAGAVISLGPFDFIPSKKLLIEQNGSEVRLTERETALLRFLNASEEHPVSRDVLIRAVWGYNSDVSSHTLETHVYRLRQKIEPDPSNATILVTEAGGYRLNLSFQ